jgi:3-oxoacyl-[acyl-carrier-protein] synthase-1
MPLRSPAEIRSIGMVTPVGLSAPQTAASVRAGIGRLSESYLSDRFGAPLVMGLADDEQLPPLIEALEDRRFSPRHERLARLGGPALVEVLAALPEQPVPLLLGIAEPRTEARHSVGEELIEILSTQAGRRLDLSHSRTYPIGRAAGLVALGDALTLIDRREAESVLVGAVDSYLDAGLLETLDREGRLKTGTIPDGFVPGEGAAFVLVAAAGAGRRQKSECVAQISGIGRGREPGHLYSQEPHRGEGLTAAFRALFDAVPMDGPADRIECVYAGLNGESFWAREWGVAQIRSADRFGEDFRVEHPADCMGDPGAALGLVMLGLAAFDLARGRRHSPCLVCCASDREERAAALLSRVGE